MFSYSEMIADRYYKKGLEAGMAKYYEKEMELERAHVMAELRLAKKMYRNGSSIKEIAEKCDLTEEELGIILF